MYKYGTIVALCLPILVACGGGDTSDGNQQNNNNHVMQNDASMDDASMDDAFVDPDASQQQDAEVQQDAAQQQDSSTPGTGITGDPCTDANQCGGITNGTPECVTDIMSMMSFPGGYCSSSTCTVGQACDNGMGICVDVGGMGFATYCLQECVDATECRTGEGYDCTTVPMSQDTTTYCLPESEMSLDGGFSMGDGGFF